MRGKKNLDLLAGKRGRSVGSETFRGWESVGRPTSALRMVRVHKVVVLDEKLISDTACEVDRRIALACMMLGEVVKCTFTGLSRLARHRFDPSWRSVNNIC